MESLKGEYLKQKTTNQEIYFYYDQENNIDQKSKVIFKNKDVLIHFPRGFEGGKKYKNIEKFEFHGFKGKLPVGVIKSPNYGYGFTKRLNSFASYVDEQFQVKKLIVKKKGPTKLDETNEKLYLSDLSLQKLNDSFGVIFRKTKAEVDTTLGSVLYELFPDKVEKPELNYVPNSISTSLSNWGHSISEFSEADKQAILDLFDKLSLTTDFLRDESLARAKEIVDSKYIQDTLEKFKELMNYTTDGEGLEKRWHEFLKSNSWIFSTIFAQPVILYKDEAYVGGKTMDNKNGKLNDFLIKNSLSDNVSFFEIKTHKTKLLENSTYRGEDVYSVTKDLTGCINQVLNQRDNFQKEFYQTKGKSKGQFETFNSKCIVLIGRISYLDENQKTSFELFRNNSRDVEIMTFDELQAKIESLQSLMKK